MDVELQRLGDMMQSEGSRLADYVLKLLAPDADPVLLSRIGSYEAMIAAISMQRTVEQWTAERRKDAGNH